MTQIKSEEKAKIKLKMIDILTEDPTISINRLSKKTGVCRATAKLYRAEMQQKIDEITNDVTKKIEMINNNQDGIWARIKQTLRL